MFLLLDKIFNAETLLLKPIICTSTLKYNTVNVSYFMLGTNISTTYLTVAI